MFELINIIFPTTVTHLGENSFYYCDIKSIKIPTTIKTFGSYVFSNCHNLKEVEFEDGMYVVEGPKIEKMLGYTNLDSEKGFAFFQKFLKDAGILDELEAAGIEEGDTVRMYGLQFDYYK